VSNLPETVVPDYLLINAGILSKTDDGMIVFPYDAIHVDFMLKAA